MCELYVHEEAILFFHTDIKTASSHSTCTEFLRHHETNTLTRKPLLFLLLLGLCSRCTTHAKCLTSQNLAIAVDPPLYKQP